MTCFKLNRVNIFRLVAILGVVLGLFCSPVKAATEAFGIALGHTTDQELKNKYPSLLVVSEGQKEVKGSTGIYLIPQKEIDFDGITAPLSVLIVPGKTVNYISAELRKDYPEGSLGGGFERIHKILSKKYKVQKLVQPYVGNKYARYINGGDVIELDAPHMARVMMLTYKTKELYNSVIQHKKREKERKNKQDENSL